MKTIIYLLLLACIPPSCSPHISALSFEGKVYKREPNRVLVVFEDYGSKTTLLKYEWWHTNEPDTIPDILRLR